MPKTIASLVAFALLTAVPVTCYAEGYQIPADDYTLPEGTYSLQNHPGGRFNPDGERIYGLVMTSFAGKDRVLFDFDHPSADMRLRITKKTIQIFGTAVARELIDGEWQHTDTWSIKFKYQKHIDIIDDGGMQDYEVYGTGENKGAFRNLSTMTKYKVKEMANKQGLTFVLGDKDGKGRRLGKHLDDLASDPTMLTDYTDSGENKVPVSGAGWITSEDDDTGKPSDWLFIVSTLTGGRV